MFDGKSKIKVLVIGADGIARKYWCNHDDAFCAVGSAKYKIDPDAVYQTSEGFFGGKVVPTIQFRANNVMPISYKKVPSIPDPEEMGSSIARAAWAIAELMRKKDENFKTMLLIGILAACILAGAGAYMGYSNGQQITKIQNQLNQTYSSPQTVPTYPSYIVPVTPIPTPVTVQPTPTPMPQTVVT